MLFFTFLLFISTSGAYVLEEECLNYTIYPAQYELTIIPHIFKDGTTYFDCDLLITVIANAPNINVIELDAKELEIKVGSIQVLDGATDIVNQHRPYEFDNKRGKLFIYLKTPLKQFSASRTQYIIRLLFVKYVSPESEGIFTVPYKDDGKQTYLYATRLSPYKAKYFFPCFNNPQYEAVFKFRVYVAPPRPGLQLSNTTLVVANELNRQNFKDDNYEIIEYIPSPQIGVHQVGFHHSQFGSREVKIGDDKLILWSRTSQLPFCTFILQFSESLIHMIHKYSMIKRPLVNTPINIVAVPKNLNGYEIGSWNLLTNSETKLLQINDYTSIKQMEEMMFELALQLCRIWLGNPGESEKTKWTEEWFKEGVASYFAYYFLTQYNHGVLKPSNRLPLSVYGLEMKHKAMAVDWHHSSPALMSFNRTLAVEIPSRYKELVSMKTASILWMVENWLGSEKFHQALIKYINLRRGRQISVSDFMENLDQDTVECMHQFFNGTTASKVLSSWFNQSGYPVVYVNVLRDRTPNAIQLKQKQFSFNNLNRFDSNYLIPISYIIQNNENCFNCYQPRFTIGSQTYTFGENLNGGWIILNRNAAGYYRVNYDDTTWKLIAKTLKENRLAIDELNRAQIVNDIFGLYATGDINEDLALEVLEFLNMELSSAVWDAAISGFELLKTEGAHMTKINYEEWQAFMRQKVSTIYKRLMDDIERTPEIRLFRSNIIDFACSIKHQPCLSDMRRIYGDHKEKRLQLDPDYRAACYYVILNNVNGNLAIDNFNNYENDDRVRVEQALRKENRFLYRVPTGHPRPLPIIMSTTTSTEPTTAMAVADCNGAATHLFPTALLIFMFLINMCSIF